MKNLMTAVLLLSIGAGSSIALGQASVSSLEKAWQQQNSICLGGETEWEGPLTARMRSACADRNAIMDQLRNLNRCYGQKTADGYAMKWHDCAPSSLTYDLPPPLRRGL